MPETHYAPSPAETLRDYNARESPRAEADLEAEAQMRDALFNLPPGIQQQPYVVICSIWPERLISPPFAHSGVGRKNYYLEPGSIEKPSYLVVQNTFTYIQHANGQDPISYIEMPIYASGLGQNLIQHWTGDHPGNRRGKKGVGIIEGRRGADGKFEATEREIETLARQQRDFLGYIVERADMHWDSGRPGDRERATSPEPRKALKLLGLDENQHPWFRSKVKQYSPCPACDERISTGAIKCGKCQENLAKHFMDRDEIPSVDEWPRVVKEIERLTARQSSKK